MATFINTKSPATIEDIYKFEKDNQITLPDDYKEFLLKYNGGQPCPSSFNFFSDRDDGSSVDRFLCLGKEKYSNLLKYYNNYKSRIPSGFIPIAHDAGGNLILIDTSLESYKVYFWDHELEVDEDEIPNMNNVYLINESFSEFINNLHETIS